MKTLQKFWLYLILIFFSLHLIRDLLQDIGLKNLYTTVLYKEDRSLVPWWYWVVFSSSYVIEILGIILAVISLKGGKFGLAGTLTIFLAAYFAIAWLVYWFLF
ncbi:MAG: hypothetical protein A3F33_01585 [Candidatus Woykebacteria bacterium RIFCSPHIGHO2_12_FULL_43_10]|uniref:DoxX family protein n=2 Tax=Candidatus Woykeibacteriota TaxID=1817899 RepID=A0A1G1WXM9_9BACT|nr:MAG: hypothetical protein A2802_00205 [Candidatus Woykebacteria bacterium RIFCSPHIGHO2_01_FULL_43_29]OGY30246.1 MAG: hypothetical protein A3J50_02240 [Candidatus Woykebacteria bacterium RIFCSPHIGHO2_02_FULL_43_16b]OGY30547.1 MAG: hypothetical protein A3F33_01585 [Candidatus Woykebacteria bacterium RIFCSPHIGHO2_12_FULL_43_10]OGY32516.1 MAG: hypothetical protein A3A61_02375 [Candidatus Woykebacteria bacterium RIFCSPLOWO2_01_FULL_43_14]